jgi:hypothetical protein
MPPRSFLNRWDLDQAVIYAVATRCWQFPAGLITTIFIAQFFTPAMQGYYYTFSTLLSLQSLVDVGLPWVILHFASHEWAHLSLTAQGTVVGPALSLERLASVVLVSRRWFAAMTLLFMVGVGTMGAIMFARQQGMVNWAVPWGCAICLAGGSLFLSPRLAILEGCNQVLRVNRIRLVQAISASICVWSAIALGAGIWAIVIAFAVQLLWELGLVFGIYRTFWSSLWPHASGRLEWGEEIWPLQWRIAVQSIVRSFAFQLFTPVMFWFHGAEVAGRMGMSWTILSNIQMAAFAPIRTRASQFGMLIAKRDYMNLDARFSRWVLVTATAYALAMTSFAGLVALLTLSGNPRAENFGARFLSPSNLFVMGVGLGAIHVAQCLALYLRAHKRDPLLGIFVLSNSLIALMVVLLGAFFGPLAAGWGFTAVALIVTLPGVSWIWYSKRRERKAAEQHSSGEGAVA